MISRDARLARPQDARGTPLHVVLVEPEIPWNTGNVGRSCLALGAQLHLVGPLGFLTDAREVRRAGLDYWREVAPREWPDWPSFEAQLPDLGEPVVVTPDGSAAFWDFEFPHRPVLLFGSETRGLPSTVRERYRKRSVFVPMRPGSIRSLNLSTCVAVVAYEVLRQQSLGRSESASSPPHATAMDRSA
jgi:tRNA (cytidine/uridine-2'-O-)-methyltransferase